MLPYLIVLAILAGLTVGASAALGAGLGFPVILLAGVIALVAWGAR